jgi:hypothetical protein
MINSSLKMQSMMVHNKGNMEGFLAKMKRIHLRTAACSLPLTLHAYILHCSLQANATLQGMDYINTEHLWITRAKDKTYIQAVFGTPKKKDFWWR